MNGSNTTPSALETGAGSHSTTRRKSSRKRNLPAEITTPPPAPSPDAPAEASSSSNSKVTAEDYREVACLFIALKVKLSKRKIERLMHCPGICGGTRIEHHIAQSRKAKKQMDASVWKALVDNAWTKWKDSELNMEAAADFIQQQTLFRVPQHHCAQFARPKCTALHYVSLD